MSSPKAKQHSDEPSAGRKISARLILAILLVVGGIAWITYYYLAVRADPTVLPPEAPSGPGWLADLGQWNYAIGFVALMLGFAVSAHPSTPLGRGRGVVVGMLGCFLLGLAWIVVFYIFSNDLSSFPVMNDLANWNLVVGIGFMAVGFAFATKWE